MTNLIRKDKTRIKFSGLVHHETKAWSNQPIESRRKTGYELVFNFNEPGLKRRSIDLFLVLVFLMCKCFK